MVGEGGEGRGGGGWRTLSFGGLMAAFRSDVTDDETDSGCCDVTEKLLL